MLNDHPEVNQDIEIWADKIISLIATLERQMTRRGKMDFKIKLAPIPEAPEPDHNKITSIFR